MHVDWNNLVKELGRSLRVLRSGTGDVYKAFSAMAQAALQTGALDTKTKELIALAIGVAIRCDDCIAFHVKAALAAGATREELMETLGMAVYMGAGPSVMYASHAVEAIEQMTKVKSE